MPALPIIEHLNVLEDIPFRVVTGGVVPMVHEFTLERPEEALHTGVVPAVPSPRARKGDRLLFAFLGITAVMGMCGMDGHLETDAVSMYNRRNRFSDR